MYLTRFILCHYKQLIRWESQIKEVLDCGWKFIVWHCVWGLVLKLGCLETIAYLEMPETRILSSVVTNVPVFILCAVKLTETHCSMLRHHHKFVSNTFSRSVPAFLFDNMTVNLQAWSILHTVTCKYSLLVRYRVFLLLFSQARQLSDIKSLPVPAMCNNTCYA